MDLLSRNTASVAPAALGIIERTIRPTQRIRQIFAPINERQTHAHRESAGRSYHQTGHRQTQMLANQQTALLIQTRQQDHELLATDPRQHGR
nr:hypothetical protein [Novosphingobium rosa]